MSKQHNPVELYLNNISEAVKASPLKPKDVHQFHFLLMGLVRYREHLTAIELGEGKIYKPELLNQDNFTKTAKKLYEFTEYRLSKVCDADEVNNHYQAIVPWVAGLLNVPYVKEVK